MSPEMFFNCRDRSSGCHFRHKMSAVKVACVMQSGAGYSTSSSDGRNRICLVRCGTFLRVFKESRASALSVRVINSVRSCATPCGRLHTLLLPYLTSHRLPQALLFRLLCGAINGHIVSTFTIFPWRHFFQGKPSRPRDLYVYLCGRHLGDFITPASHPVRQAVKSRKNLAAGTPVHSTAPTWSLPVVPLVRRYIARTGTCVRRFRRMNSPSCEIFREIMVYLLTLPDCPQ